MWLVGGAHRWAVSDRVAIDSALEFSFVDFHPFRGMVSVGGRYTSDPQLHRETAVWYDLEFGGGVSGLTHPEFIGDTETTAAGGYLGAGLGLRHRKFIAFTRYRAQLSAMSGMTSRPYNHLSLGVQYPLSDQVSLYGATGVATFRADWDVAGGGSYWYTGAYWIHADSGLRVRFGGR